MAEETKTKSFEETHADLIAAKVNAGLRREDAIQVIKHQIENDAAKKNKPVKK